MTIEAYTAPFAEAMLADSDALGIRRADLYPRATAYVDRMIDLIQRLLDRGFAYATDDGSVWYDISAFDAYGRLSGGTWSRDARASAWPTTNTPRTTPGTSPSGRG
jgi:cysteinyl-tRNA synthetase